MQVPTEPRQRTRASAPGGGVEIVARNLWKTFRAGQHGMQDVSATIRPGEIAAIIGASGAGKTTLLEALAGVRFATRGDVTYDGVSLYEHFEHFRGSLGYVPQEDVIHTELALDRTLRFSAALRLPAGGLAARLRADDALELLGLEGRKHVRVGALSGGERKRASIASEWLTSPRVLLLDEPTSGLDPLNAAEVMRVLGVLADRGSTVVFTTHNLEDLAYCDRLLVLAGRGRMAFSGPPSEALAYFGVDKVEALYELLAGEERAQQWAERFTTYRVSHEPPIRPPVSPLLPEPRRVPFARQWRVLTRRTLETLIRSPLTMTILVACPAAIVAMFAMLFRGGAFDMQTPNVSTITMILFWMAFAAFFFGITYGLLQVVTEQAIVRRERFVGQDLRAYLGAKFAVLLPFLLFVVVLTLGVLRLLNRLPAVGLDAYVAATVTLMIEAAGALALGLLTSAAVRTPAQATLALPMLCFPAVLFSGAILPVHVMAWPGAWLSAVVPVRWAFEAVGGNFGAWDLMRGASDGEAFRAAYGGVGTHHLAVYWLLLTALVIFFMAASWVVLRRRYRPGI